MTASLPGISDPSFDPVTGPVSRGAEKHSGGLESLWRRFDAAVDEKRKRREMEERMRSR